MGETWGRSPRCFQARTGSRTDWRAGGKKEEGKDEERQGKRGNNDAVVKIGLEARTEERYCPGGVVVEQQR